MNAAEQSTSLEATSKIAAAANLFKAEFPDAKADFKPWVNDSDTRELVDPESIDIGFHFPGFSRLLQSRSLLLQIRFYEDSQKGERRAIGAEITGFDHRGKQWWLSTVDTWAFEGSNYPTPEMGEKLKAFLRNVLELFSS